MRRGRTEAAGDDLAATAFELRPEPRLIWPIAAEVETGRERRRCRKFVAGSGIDEQVECLATTAFGIGIFVKALIIHRREWTDRQPSSLHLIRDAG